MRRTPVPRSSAREPAPALPRLPAPGGPVVVVGWLMAAWCVGFAAVNVGLVAGDSFEGGPYAEYADGLAAMSWIVFALKLVGAAVALDSVRDRPGAPAPALGVLLWGATALLGVYVTGSLLEVVGMVTGLTGSPEEITPSGVLYVAFFLAGALGYGVLATSFARRSGTGLGSALIGLLLAPVGLGLLLVGIPLVLVALGVMPGY